MRGCGSLGKLRSYLKVPRCVKSEAGTDAAHVSLLTIFLRTDKYGAQILGLVHRVSLRCMGQRIKSAVIMHTHGGGVIYRSILRQGVWFPSGCTVTVPPRQLPT